MANVNFFEGKQTDGKKLYAPDVSMWGVKSNFSQDLDLPRNSQLSRDFGFLSQENASLYQEW